MEKASVAYAAAQEVGAATADAPFTDCSGLLPHVG